MTEKTAEFKRDEKIEHIMCYLSIGLLAFSLLTLDIKIAWMGVPVAVLPLIFLERRSKRDKAGKYQSG